MKNLFEYSKSGSVDQGIVVPIHNMAETIVPVLNGIFDSVSRNSHLVLILDACSDKSEQVILEFLKIKIQLNELGNVIRINLFNSRRNLFEAKAENFAIDIFKELTYLISVQADIVIQEKFFDSKIVEAFVQNPDVFMISGRGTHTWEIPEEPVNPFVSLYQIFDGLKNIFRFGVNSGDKADRKILNKRPSLKLDHDSFYELDYFGRCGDFHSHFVETGNDCIYLSETVMRGPLAFRLKEIRKLGGLDWKRHRLGNDDHCISMKAWHQRRLRTAYMPIEYVSPLEWGATRKNKNFKELFSFGLMRIKEFFYHRKSCELQRNRENMILPKKEIRKFIWNINV